ncbi:NADP-dependent oxidoreductase [Rugamonas apoptosis]|uniref:NADP-dependent oxidoreductase n=1 Tax=Rugamonas apoptosis TaxID=2758570 RepID=A0A7W2FCA6_9BURK|nr:NADP-dependent oxidoreductase [Rugamonas apoptosis]MBA5689110.1 NADP-dependent oxidoreductase [Rugamonas apoptosis]
MKAYVIDRYGASSAVRAAEMPEPELGGSDVLVEIHAASVNPLDLKIRSGGLKMVLPYRLPLILGNDLAGVVVRVGARVRGYKPGDQVYARPPQERIGTFAEYIAVSEDALAPKPHTLSMEEAAAMPLVGLTGWQALVEMANVRQGQKVLIHAGSGGVGSFAIQLAKSLGAYVATTTSAANRAWVQQLGADVVIDYKQTDFSGVLHDYDVVLDTQGGEALMRSVRVLKPGGRLISISGPPDPDFAKASGAPWFVRVAMGLLSYRIRKLARRHQVRYSFLFMRADGTQLRSIAGLIDGGVIRPVVDKVFPFASTAEALDYVQTGRAKGKVVIKVKS